MTAPSYTEDLTDFATGDELESTGTWDESSDGNWDNQGSPAGEDAEYPYIQGSYAYTADCTKTGVGTIIADYGSDTGGHGTDGAYLIWVNFSSPYNIDTYANGGIRCLVGSSLGDFKSYDVGGKDKGRMPFGGWQNFAINSSVTADDTVGTPTATEQYSGAAVNVTTGISKGEVFQVDCIRFGRCSSIFEYGETADYCTIDGFATQNDNLSNMWGLIQAVPGGYLWKGRMSLGTVSNAVDFRDSNVIIFVDWTPKVTSNFNTIEIINASSNVEMTGFQFICLDPSTTASKGRWITTNDATVDLTSCSFTDMATFTFDSNTILDSCTFTRCAQITTGGCDMGGSDVLSSTVATDTGALYCDTTYTDTYFDNIIFEMGTNSHHAIDFGTSVTSNLTLRNCAFNGFGSTDDSNDSTVRFLATSGSLTLSLVNCTVDGVAATTSNFSIDDAAGVTVTLSIDPVTLSVHVNDNNGDDLSGARVFVEASDNTGDLPFEETVTSITRSGTTATVTHTSHGLVTNDYVNLQGITDKTEDNWGAHQVTVNSVDEYEYTTTDSGSTNYTGTIKATGVLIHGTTDGNGDISRARTFGANQPIKGFIRKSSSSPRFKSFDLAGNEVNSSNGLSINVRMVLDE